MSSPSTLPGIPWKPFNPQPPTRKAMPQFCYHITNGVTRSALICGTVTAATMDEAAEIAASRSHLTRLVDEDGRCEWFNEDGKRRSVYVKHDPHPAK